MPFDPRVHVGVAAAIINPDKELLLVKRKGAHGAGEWALPGGWVDYKESPEETVARELEEEIDLWIPTSTFVLWDAISTTFDAPVDTSITLLYGTKHWSHNWVPMVMENDKISDLQWIRKVELQERIVDDTIAIFEPLQNLLNRPNNRLLKALGSGFYPKY